MKEEGVYYYLVENASGRKFHGSLEPPLGSSGSKSRHATGSEIPPSPAGLGGDTSIETGNGSAAEDKVATTISPLDFGSELESTAVESMDGDGEPVLMADVPDNMVESSVTLVSVDEDSNKDEVLSNEYPVKKTVKRRYESGTTSIPGAPSFLYHFDFVNFD